MSKKILLIIAISCVIPATRANSAQPAYTLESIMAEPDWISANIQSAWWSLDGATIYYQQKRQQSTIIDTYQQPLDNSQSPRVVSAQNQVNDPLPIATSQSDRIVYFHHGNIFLRYRSSGQQIQITRDNDIKLSAHLTTNGGVMWNVGSTWYLWHANKPTYPILTLKAEIDPSTPPEHDDLADEQMGLLATLRNEHRQHLETVQNQLKARQNDRSQAPSPIYLGAKVSIVSSALSPNLQWAVVVTQPADINQGRAGAMPIYLTESGYEEYETVRNRVGRNSPSGQTLWLVNIATHHVIPLPLDSLPGITADPLAFLARAAGKPPMKGIRPVRILTEGPNDEVAIRWTADGRQVAIALRSVDNKDRWITTVDFLHTCLRVRHHLHDDAWINWDFNSLGWMPDQTTLWFLSEESGWSHLYLLKKNGTTEPLTRGQWEVSQPQPSPDGSSFYFLCNRRWPGNYEVCRLDRSTNTVNELTQLHGVSSFALAPDGQTLLVRYSSSYLPTQLALVPAAGGPARQLTDTRQPDYRSRTWINPAFVQIPSSHGGGMIWAKFYGPTQLSPNQRYPLILFVHGAGYIQNVSERYPYYFREQLFNNYLVQHGYLVLDIDYRASAGYGRKWRTAIYRNMGTAELDDLRDGVDWLVRFKQGDHRRAGIYGGSYGGYLTLMAMFRTPGVFRAGAALRAVSDWMQYNNDYTSNILNTPQLDPSAYSNSSAIQYANGLCGHLLIAHGMMDDNVFFKDSVMLAQRLIELHKDNWTLAPYPLERHEFSHADAWLDEYKRIFRLFEEHVKPAPIPAETQCPNVSQH